MIEEIKAYAETLRGFAKKGRLFYLDLVPLRFTMDMMEKTLLFDLSIVLVDEQRRK